MMTLRVTWAALALALAPLPALAAAEAPAPPAQCRKLTGWFEDRSAHFHVSSDLSPAAARSLIRELEYLRALLIQALFGEQVEVPGHVRVVTFSSPSRFEDLGSKSGGYIHRDSFDEPTIVIPQDGLKVSPGVAAHEIAHLLSWHVFPRQANWFSEGLAMFVETVAYLPQQVAPPVGTRIVRTHQARAGRWAGETPQSWAERLAQVRPVKAADLLSWRDQRDEASPDRLHLWSWVLYHYLWNQRSKQLSAYQARLGEGAAPAVAWQAAFPEYDPARPETLEPLDAALDKYIRTGQLGIYKVEAEVAEPAVERSPLHSSDVHLLLLDERSLWSEPKDRPALWRDEVDEALREDPAQPRAILLRANREKASPLAGLRAAVQARPDDWRAWLLLGQALEGAEPSAEREAAYRRAVALAPENSIAHNNLAWLLSQSGRSRAALPLANRAVDLAPWSPSAIDTLAAVAADLGKCREAVVLEQRAVELVDPGPARAGYESRRAAFEARCPATGR
jgi:tetratricopeptide (TPR) repeat protein